MKNHITYTTELLCNIGGREDGNPWMVEISTVPNDWGVAGGPPLGPPNVRCAGCGRVQTVIQMLRITANGKIAQGSQCGWCVPIWEMPLALHAPNKSGLRRLDAGMTVLRDASGKIIRRWNRNPKPGEHKFLDYIEWRFCTDGNPTSPKYRIEPGTPLKIITQPYTDRSGTANSTARLF